MVSMFNGGFFNDRLVQISIYAAVIFYIVAHPETFKFVDGVLGLGGKDKSTLLLVHTAVVGVLMFFGTKMIFDPVMRGLVDGFTNNKKKPVVRKASPSKRPVGRAPTRPAANKRR